MLPEGAFSDLCDAGVASDDEDFSINKTSVFEFLDSVNFEEIPGIRQKFRREHRAFEARTWDLTQRHMKEAKELGLNEQEAKDALVQHMFEQEIYKNGKFNSYLHERNHDAIIKQALAPVHAERQSPSAQGDAFEKYKGNLSRIFGNLKFQKHKATGRLYTAEPISVFMDEMDQAVEAVNTLLKIAFRHLRERNLVNGSFAPEEIPFPARKDLFWAYAGDARVPMEAQVPVQIHLVLRKEHVEHLERFYDDIKHFLNAELHSGMRSGATGHAIRTLQNFGRHQRGVTQIADESSLNELVDLLPLRSK